LILIGKIALRKKKAGGAFSADFARQPSFPRLAACRSAQASADLAYFSDFVHLSPAPAFAHNVWIRLCARGAAPPQRLDSKEHFSTE
jgi:hypothetical protein